MSETLCTLRTKGGGGGRYTETSLWTNSAPTSDFAAQTVTLSDSIDNYKYIAIKFKAAKTIDNEAKAIFLVDDLKKSLVGNSANHITLSVSSQNDANSLFARTVGYVSSTSISFTVANRGASTATYTNQSIPLEILGLNELATGHKTNDTLLWSNSDPTTTFSAQTVTLSDDITDYDFIKVNYNYSTTYSSAQYQYTVMMPLSVFIKDVYAEVDYTPALFLGVYGSSNTARKVMYISSTTVRIGSAYTVNAQSSANNRCIPTAIYGVKLS